jgi:hypothetical protein
MSVINAVCSFGILSSLSPIFTTHDRVTGMYPYFDITATSLSAVKNQHQQSAIVLDRINDLRDRRQLSASEIIILLMGRDLFIYSCSNLQLPASTAMLHLPSTTPNFSHDYSHSTNNMHTLEQMTNPQCKLPSDEHTQLFLK